MSLQQKNKNKNPALVINVCSVLTLGLFCGFSSHYYLTFIILLFSGESNIMRDSMSN